MRCPHCNKRIRSDAGNVICPHCGEFIMSQIKEREVDTVDHDKIEAERSEIRSEKKTRGARFRKANGAALSRIGKIFVDTVSVLFSSVGCLFILVAPFLLAGLGIVFAVAFISVPIINFIRYYIFRISIEGDD